MPEHNAFRHQAYQSFDTNADCQLLQLASSRTDHPATIDAAVQSWRDAGIQALYLIHGTFTGDDAFGLLHQLERYAPEWGRLSRRWGKQFVDRLAADLGNYTESYAQRVGQVLGSQICVRRFQWSGENLHTARAQAAIELLDTLCERLDQGESNVALWGHSHGGNVCALLTNLLGQVSPSHHRLFRVLKQIAAEDDQGGEGDLAPRIRRVEQRVQASDFHGLRLSIATFGTPIRYGWESSGYTRLLHLVHHRAAPGTAETRTPFPPTSADFRHATHGDVIQQLGIAGTDFHPYLFSSRLWRVERALGNLIGGRLGRAGLLRRLKLGVRVADEGRVLLVDYGDDENHTRSKLLGHAIYTCDDWLLATLRLIATQWFG